MKKETIDLNMSCMKVKAYRHQFRDKKGRFKKVRYSSEVALLSTYDVYLEQQIHKMLLEEIITEANDNGVEVREKISWEAYYSDVKILAEKIKASGKKYDSIYGIPRGGSILAVCLSHLLNLPVMFDRNRLMAIGLSKALNKEFGTTRFNTSTLYKSNILVVDDIADSGKTITKYAKHFDTATIYRKFDCSSIPTYYVNVNKRWIIFPYECPEVKDTVSKVTGDKS